MSDKSKQVKKKENAIQRYFRETSGELRKVSWPTWPEARRLTGLVLLVMLIVGSLLAVVDFAAGEILRLILA